MKDLKENTSGQSQIILRPTLRVGSVVQVIEYENGESKYLGSMKIKTAIWNLHGDGKMYYEVYDENVDDTRELCWKEDSFDTNGFLSGIVIDSVYGW